MDDDNNYIHVTNKSKLTFKGMWTRNDLSDVKLCCDKQEFNVHRFLLAACSPYFRALFRENSSLDSIDLNDIECGDLRRVLLYMYEGSVVVKDDDLQGFGELLEMFWMPLPEEMNVEDSEDESDTYETDDSSFQDNGVDIEQFIPKIHDLLKEIAPDTIDNLSKEILSLAEGSSHGLGAVVNIIIQSVVKLTPTCRSSILGSLVKSICHQDKSQVFKQHIRQKSLQVLRYLVNAVPMERTPLSLHEVGGFNLLDKEVVRIETIEYNWDTIRRQRLTHFVAQLFSSNLVSLTDIFDIMKADAMRATDLVIGETSQCCDLEVPSAAQEIIQNEEYRYACQIENHLFWLRIENNQHELREFNGIVNQGTRKRDRKRNRGKRSKGNKAKSEPKRKAKAQNPGPSTSKK